MKAKYSGTQSYAATNMDRSKGFFFDFDGTLVATHQDLLNALLYAIEVKAADYLDNIDPDYIAQFIAYGGRGMLKESGIPEHLHSQIHPVFLEYYTRNISQYSHFYAGLDRLLLTLQSHQMPHGIVTNKPVYLVRKLLNQLLPDWDGLILGADDKECPTAMKPHPERLHVAMQRFQLEAENCYYVGDAWVDVETANNSACRSVIVSYGYHTKEHPPHLWEVDYLFETPEQLQEFVLTLSLGSKVAVSKQQQVATAINNSN